MSAKINKNTERSQIISVSIAFENYVSIKYNYATGIARSSGVFDSFNVISADFVEESDEDGLIAQNFNATISSRDEDILRKYANQRAVVLLTYSDGRTKILGIENENPLVIIKFNTPKIDLSIDRRTSKFAPVTYFSPC